MIFFGLLTGMLVSTAGLAAAMPSLSNVVRDLQPAPVDLVLGVAPPAQLRLGLAHHVALLPA